jgi:hypothetical protein
MARCGVERSKGSNVRREGHARGGSFFVRTPALGW